MKKCKAEEHFTASPKGGQDAVCVSGGRGLCSASYRSRVQAFRYALCTTSVCKRRSRFSRGPWRLGSCCCLGAGPGCLERFRLSRNRLELSRAARLSREGSGYLERSGYLEGGFEITRASRWLGPLRMTRSAQDDSVRYETSHVPRHCKVFNFGLNALRAPRYSLGRTP